MTNPTPQVVQTFMAELLGWTDSKRSPIDNRLWGLPPQDTVAELDLGKYMLVPNWPRDRNASGWLIKEMPINSVRPAISAYEECIEFIKYKGYKWVECAACEGKPERISGGVVGPITAVRCSACSGNGGEFMKV